MNSVFSYLVELNISLMILFVAYKLFFEKDRNFVIRRIFLLGVAVLPILLPMVPRSIRMPVSEMAPVSITLEEITIFGNGSPQEAAGSTSFINVLFLIYLAIAALGLIKLLFQLARILRATASSRRFEAGGTNLLASPSLHASSFFGYIFIDPARIKEDSFPHILEHEGTHKREWHSLDRVLVEVFVVINWFNPVAWMFHKAVIQNLEFLADSAVLRKGTDPMKYQLSILNQYIGSASISNQFSSQIKNRINMLNKNYKLGSRWKLFLLVPLTLIAFFFVACTEKETAVNEDAIASEVQELPTPNDDVAATKAQRALEEEEIFYIVENMPKFNGDETYMEFRKYIAQNLIYPAEAIENGATGKVFVTFVVTKEGKVMIPDKEALAKVQAKSLDEVVVVAYRTLQEDAEVPDEKYIQLLKDESVRVVSGSPDWEPGSQRGTKVNVVFTFPISFALQ